MTLLYIRIQILIYYSKFQFDTHGLAVLKKKSLCNSNSIKNIRLNCYVKHNLFAEKILK